MAYHGPEIKLFNNKKEQETYENLAGAFLLIPPESRVVLLSDCMASYPRKQVLKILIRISD
jgi:hypothetical protein